MHRIGSESSPECPKCKGATTPKSDPRGQFWRCVRFPECDGIVDLDDQKQPKLLEAVRTTTPQSTNASGILLPRSTVMQMTGLEFEKYLERLFVHAGFRVKRTPESRDHGADLIMVAPDQTKWVVQAKRWGKKVGVDALREVFLAQFLEDADRAVVITNNTFTPDVKLLKKALAKKGVDIDLWEGPELYQAMQALTWDSSLPIPKSQLSESETKLCPKCNAYPMIARVNGETREPFYGCRRWPICKGSRQMARV